MPDIEFQLQGLDGVLKRLKALPKKVERKLLRRAVRKGATIIRDAARQNARAVDDPSTPESIEKNIVVQESSRLGRSEGGVAMRVGVRGGARAPANGDGDGKANPGGDTFYWRFIEFGTSKMQARPFMRPAMENNIEAATQAVTDELNKGLDAAADL